VADFKASPSVGDEISKGRNRYRFDGIGWSTIHRSTLRTGTLVVTKDSWYFIATAGQTTITGNDSSGKALSYDTNAEIEVFINGIKVKEGSSSDYVLTSSSVLTLNEALKVGEEVEIVQRSRFADTEVSGKVDATSAQTLTTAADALTISDHTITLTRGDGSTDAVTVPDNNNTYSVGDGGLTQKNFTTTLKNKLDGIAASANNYSLPAASSSTRGGVKIGFTESGKNYPVELSSEKMFVNVPWTDTNTTYSVGDGGLTQKNFTTTLKNKLDGIATGATADQTASEILTAIKTVDGSGSGLDADKLGGLTKSVSATGSTIMERDSSGDTSIRILTITNELRFPTNTAASDPSITCSSDGDTGLSFDGSGDMWFSSNGTKQFDFSELFHDGYHPNADKWTTARTLSLTGDVTGSVSWDGSANASLTAAVANDSHGHSNYLPLSGGTMTGTLDLNVADSLSFEGGKHWITYNDGEGNFNIRVGHKSDDLTNEVCTETGYVFHDEWSQSSGWREFNVSGSSIPTVGDDVGSWRKQIYYDYNEVGLAYQGSNKFKTTSGGVNITGNIAVSGTVDGRDVATDGSKLDGIASSANNYSLPAGSSSTRGGFKIGYAESGKNYPVEVSSEKMYVNVPWTDNNTTYSAGSLLDLSGTTFNVDLSELTELQGWQNGHQFTLVDSHGEQGYLLPADIDLADFDNTAGWASGDFEIGTQNTASATTTLSYDSGDTLVLQNDGTGDFLTGRKQGQEKFNITNTGAATFASVTTSGGNVVDDEHFTQITHHAYYSSSTSGVYIPAAGTLSEQTSVQYYNKFLAPYAGKVKKVIINCSSAPGLTDMTVYQGSTTIGAQTLYVPSAGHATSFDFAGGTSTFSKHDDIRIKIDPTSPAYQVFVTVVWEYNLTT